MSWHTLRNGLALAGLTVAVSWGISTFTYGSSPGSDLRLSGEATGADKADKTVPSPTPTKTTRGTADEDEGSEEGPLIPRGVTAQVLDGSGIEGARGQMVRRLRRLGIDVVNVDSAFEAPGTTVFWTSRKSKPAARALAREFNWASRVKPPAIFAPADIHVLIGRDF